MQYWLLRLHRWLALLFAVPLAVIIVTGLILSLEPAAVGQAARTRGLTVEVVGALIARHDPNGQANALSYRSYDGTLTIGGGRGARGVTVAVDTGEVRDAPGAAARLFMLSRQLHERLLLDAGWLVTTSTAAMLVLILIGVLMGWPRFTNSLSGWHRGVAWIALPLLVLSPVTALMMAAGMTFAPAPVAGAPRAAAGAAVKLADAVRLVAREHDLAGLVWIRPMRGSLAARILVDGEYRLFRVAADRLEPVGRNWPRLLHEGNYAGLLSAGINVVISLGFVILLVTGVWIWARRRLRRRQPRAGLA